LKTLQNDCDADDTLQDVLLEIWNHALGYDPAKGRPIAWICTLARRRAIDRLRKRSAYYQAEDRFAAETNHLGQTWNHVHEDAAQTERQQCIQSALATLPREQGSALHLAYQREMTQREIAAFTHTPLGTVKTRIELGLRKMAVCLHGREDLLPASVRPSALLRHTL
jgi:RNA polymerase sigma-70 factor (ECF subfamily)